MNLYMYTKLKELSEGDKVKVVGGKNKYTGEVNDFTGTVITQGVKDVEFEKKDGEIIIVSHGTDPELEVLEERQIE